MQGEHPVFKDHLVLLVSPVNRESRDYVESPVAMVNLVRQEILVAQE